MAAQVYSKKDKKFPVLPNLADYEKLHAEFNWSEASKELDWFEDGKLNAAYNAIDRHAKGDRKDKLALIWEGAKGEKKQYTFLDLFKLSNKFANLIKNKGAQKGDRIFIFLPRIPYLYTAFLAILKNGSVAGLLFSAFQEQALLDRLSDSGAKILFTNSELAKRVEGIRSKLPELKEILIVDTPEFENELAAQPDSFETVKTDPSDFAFMLYTSGTTGKPKGVVHHHYAIVAQHATAKYVLDIHDTDIYWCTADPGWVTGIAYTILGSWSCGVTSFIDEGRFDPSRWFQKLQDYKINIWYTAPTAIRMIMAEGEDLPKKYDLSHLRHILSVGEPLNPEAIHWSIKTMGMPFHDTWWQTETGCISIANYPTMDIKIGSMGKPFLGMEAAIVDDAGKPVANDTEGNIALRPGWPSMMKTIWQRQEKYDSYFINNWYLSGDRGYRDSDGYFWFIGRSDDVIKTSGERVGPFEVESALVEHPAVVEAGVIGKPDQARGEVIKAFVVLEKEYLDKVKTTEEAQKLKDELSQYVKKHLAGHAYPREVEFIDKLPKTRSGKIMRRILKAKEMGQPVGDTSTLEEY
ncbi:MAG: acetyl-CoA synthetase, acetyl-CoA synthetase [Candidatus Gottesmanbacteria bacterium GW2011_GWA2_43_14]|uniref:acetate--CoA ligase n=1 Tax=Candidatus Gottesmanbacteria bacterium GW2011_GWA2_43_14 TaxID=1618443 RepID=A0A0G1DKY5_9BACT|nr:MAG: acetyl-CoA synthetase, acetyl-CoA synthetase [Candidatus Gottesmanbacteria bacterium GW2011_GWA2_43_14]